jgi:DNA-binding MarR family transcriptional regulator
VLRISVGQTPDSRELLAVRAIPRLARMAERALGDLSLAHYRVLSAIAFGDARASRVAINLSLGKPTVGAIVDALCRGGLVKKSAVENDQRASALAITAPGRAVLDRADAALVARLRDLELHDVDIPALMATLAAVGAALEAQAQDRTTLPKASARS